MVDFVQQYCNQTVPALKGVHGMAFTIQILTIVKVSVALWQRGVLRSVVACRHETFLIPLQLMYSFNANTFSITKTWNETQVITQTEC